MHKYIHKIQVNGRTRYFYDQKEYDAYLEGRKDQAEVNNPNAKKKTNTPRTMTDQEKRAANARKEYAKKSGDYSVSSYSKSNKTMPMTQYRTQQANAAVKNASNATKNAVKRNTREWRRETAAKGKAFIDNLLRPEE